MADHNRAILPDPAPDAPLGISRAEFGAARVRLAATGIALKHDRDHAGRDYCGWRVNDDDALLLSSFSHLR